MSTNMCTEISQRIRERKASTRTPFVHRKDVVTDLEKCCITIQSIQPFHSQARRAPGCSHSRKKNIPFGFSGVDDCWEIYPSKFTDTVLCPPAICGTLLYSNMHARYFLVLLHHYALLLVPEAHPN